MSLHLMIDLAAAPRRLILILPPLAASVFILLSANIAFGQDSGGAAKKERDDAALVAGRPAFSLADQPSERAARCSEVRAMAKGLADTETRIDLTVIGRLVTVKTDGVLWYLAICQAPDAQIVCVTYQKNDMKPGDAVFLKGGYRELGPAAIVLDPCLANRPDDADMIELDGDSGPGATTPPP